MEYYFDLKDVQKMMAEVHREPGSVNPSWGVVAASGRLDASWGCVEEAVEI